MTAGFTALLLAAITGLAEWLHLRRCRRVAHLAFGPSGQPRPWTRFVPLCRVLAVAALAWGLVTLASIRPRTVRSEPVPEGGYRHLLLALDVSPSMQLKDAGPAADLTRAQRANEVLSSLLDRIALDQIHVSIIAFYTSAKPVVIDTFDIEVVRNAINELPLEIAFEVGKTAILEGVRQAAEIAKPWQAQSTTLVIASDGDSIPDSGMPDLPRSIHRTLVVGLGDPLTGKFIDGHQSRQDVATLRSLAARLRGDYFNANEKQLPSHLLAALSGSLPLRDTQERGRRELALAAVGTGAATLALLPMALALCGAAWQIPRYPREPVRRSSPAPTPVTERI